MKNTVLQNIKEKQIMGATIKIRAIRKNEHLKERTQKNQSRIKNDKEH